MRKPKRAHLQVRLDGESQPWEQISVSETVFEYETADEVDALCAFLMRQSLIHATEMRWTWEDSIQGHYVPRWKLEEISND